jgi:hypothetical protein
VSRKTFVGSSHSSSIERIAVNDASSVFATASFDSEIVIWSCDGSSDTVNEAAVDGGNGKRRRVHAQTAEKVCVRY